MNTLNPGHVLSKPILYLHNLVAQSGNSVYRELRSIHAWQKKFRMIVCRFFPQLSEQIVGGCAINRLSLYCVQCTHLFHCAVRLREEREDDWGPSAAVDGNLNSRQLKRRRRS